MANNVNQCLLEPKMTSSKDIQFKKLEAENVYFIFLKNYSNGLINYKKQNTSIVDN